MVWIERSVSRSPLVILLLEECVSLGKYMMLAVMTHMKSLLTRIHAEA